MKCPKCGYISFDHNLSCPKCNKDISIEQARLNIPAFMPNPLFLLGLLTGESEKAHAGFGVDTSSFLGDTGQDDILGLSESLLDETDDFSFDESQETEIIIQEDVSGEAEESKPDFDSRGETVLFDESPLDALDEDAQDGEPPLEEDEFSLDFEDLSSAPPETAQTASPVEQAEIGGEDLTLGLNKVSEDDVTLGGLYESEADLELGDLEMEFRDSEEIRQSDFELDDEDDAREEGANVKDEELQPDEISLEEAHEFQDMEASEEAKEESGDKIDVEALEGLDLKFQDSKEAFEKGEDEINLKDLKVNATGELEIGSQEEIFSEEAAVESIQESEDSFDLESINGKGPFYDPGQAEPEDFDIENTLLELDDIPLSEESVTQFPNHGESEMSFDLEDLDLDLDLEDDPDNNLR
ncbi:MAG: hypothetical protein ACOWYE_09410 [Desulfatiglandales bacterium]